MRKFIGDIAATAHLELMAKFRDQALTPTADDLFNIDPDSRPLNSEKAECFHTSTAKLLLITPRARPDMSLTVSFFMHAVETTHGTGLDKQQGTAVPNQLKISANYSN